MTMREVAPRPSACEPILECVDRTMRSAPTRLAYRRILTDGFPFCISCSMKDTPSLMSIRLMDSIASCPIFLSVFSYSPVSIIALSVMFITFMRKYLARGNMRAVYLAPFIMPGLLSVAITTRDTSA